MAQTSFGVWNYVAWFIVPSAIDALLIAILSVTVQVLSPNKYLGWGIVFVWFVGTIFLSNMGYNNPLYTVRRLPQRPAERFCGAGQLLEGRRDVPALLGAVRDRLRVIAHALWPRGTDVGLRVRLKRMRHRLAGLPLALIGVAAAGMAATGAYAYYNIKVLNLYRTSDEVEKQTADYERKYLKYEKLPRPSVTKVTLDVQLYPGASASLKRPDVTTFVTTQTFRSATSNSAV